MDLDELRSVQSRERQTDSLQQLRETFYQDVGEFIESLKAERERAADQADDPWNSPEVGRLSDDIETAEQTVEAIYERRVGKIVKMASLAAADMPTEDDGLTEEEERLFESLVAQIEDNRAHVEAVLDGDPPPREADEPSGETTMPDPSAVEGDTDASTERHGTPETTVADTSPATQSTDASDSVDAADLMGSGPPSDEAPNASADDTADSQRREHPTPPEAEPSSDGTRDLSKTTDGTADARETPETTPDGGVRSASASGDASQPAGEETRREAGSRRDSERSAVGDDGGESSTSKDADVDRATVRITDDVGEIFGVDQRAYDLSSSDVVTLPEKNATPLVDRGAAERLE